MPHQKRKRETFAVQDQLIAHLVLPTLVGSLTNEPAEQQVSLCDRWLVDVLCGGAAGGG